MILSLLDSSDLPLSLTTRRHASPGSSRLRDHSGYIILNFAPGSSQAARFRLADELVPEVPVIAKSRARSVKEMCTERRQQR